MSFNYLFTKIVLFLIILRSSNACFGGCGLGLGLMPGLGGFGGLGLGGMGIGGLGGLYPGMYGGGLGLGAMNCMGCGGFGYGVPPMCCSPYFGGGFIGKRSVHWHLKASRARQRVKHRRDARLNKIKMLESQSRLYV